MKALVFGRTGQIATELQRLAPVTALGRETVDLRDPGACAAAIHAHRPEAVINAAAFTAVDGAETEEALASRINADAPQAMARACAELRIPLVHLSTDYVFAGDGAAPHAPDAPTRPLNAYGRSKLKGEMLVRAQAGAHVILRTSWVVSAHGRNFVKTMLRLGAAQKRLRVVADQIGGPTPAAAVAAACLSIAEQLAADPARSGVYHFSGAPDISWADFAREIFAAASLPATVEDIASAEYPVPARRPLNSRLDCRTAAMAFGLQQPAWREHLPGILAELAKKDPEP